MQPKTKYVRSGDVHIAYQVVGMGPLDIVYVPGWVSHLELAWELPDLVFGFKSLASFARLILFDKTRHRHVRSRASGALAGAGRADG